MVKFKNKLGNFNNAIQRLTEAIEEYKQINASNVVRDGVIQRFEFTYELAWKTIKEYLGVIGIVDINAPRAAIKEAYVQKLIINENNWILMLNDRNMTSHVYNEVMAEEIAERITNIYIKEFETLLLKLQNSQ